MRPPSHPAVVAALSDPTLPLRFWSHATLPVTDDPAWPSGPNVDGIETACWIWTHNLDRQGFGRYVIRGHQSGATRIAMALGEAHQRPRNTPPEKREWQLGGQISATCDHRDCVRPSHLRLTLSSAARATLLGTYGRTSVTLAELPTPTPSLLRRPRSVARAAARAQRATLQVVDDSLRDAGDVPDIALDIAPARPSTREGAHAGATPLPDGTLLVVAPLLRFGSGSYLVYTPWGPFDGDTIDEATRRAAAGHPDARSPRTRAA